MYQSRISGADPTSAAFVIHASGRSTPAIMSRKATAKLYQKMPKIAMNLAGD